MLIIVSGCASTTAEIVLGAPVADNRFQGTGPTATLRLRQNLNDTAFCEYQHVSYVVVDSVDEDRLDMLGCGVRFGGGD